MKRNEKLRQGMILESSPCPKCGHHDGDHREAYGTPQYQPLVFHCSVCDCKVDKRHV